MYAPPYGFGPGNNSGQFIPNGAQPLPHQQQPGHQPQHMMYNPQQYGAGGHQSPYGTPGPGMLGNAGGLGMMPNNGHVSPYQTPYTSSPYGSSIPTAASASLNINPQGANYISAASNAPSFQMNAPNMAPQQQHLLQRMQPPPQTSAQASSSGPPRASPYGGAPHGTPPNVAQSQFSTPQNSNQTHLQTAGSNQQPQGGGIGTPQTPTFPPGPQGATNAGSNAVPPLSPGSEALEKERVTLMLEINGELLMEVMRLQAAQKKEESGTNATNTDRSGEKENVDKEKTEKSKAASGREYVECMRRLQCNLAYLAAIADRHHKPSSQIPPHPAIMSAPPLTPKKSLSSNSAAPSGSPETGIKKGESEDKKSEVLAEEDRVLILKEQYRRLQGFFPGVDPKKEPVQSANSVAKAQAQQHGAQMQAQRQQQGQGGDQNQNQQVNQTQKMQNDLLRQKMLQQQAQISQQMGHGMHGLNAQGQAQN